MYEGQDKNPEMCRVLLTHEVMCRYCSDYYYYYYYYITTIIIYFNFHFGHCDKEIVVVVHRLFRKQVSKIRPIKFLFTTCPKEYVSVPVLWLNFLS